jgi:hypothetical protein
MLYAEERGQVFTLPSKSTAPPMITTSFTLKKVSGSSAAAVARFVRGPIAMMEIVPASFSRKSLSVSLWAG